MEAINTIFLIFIIIGFALILYALVQVQKKEQNNNSIFTIEQAVEKLNSTIQESDKAIDELNNLAEQVFLQFDEKKNELLFLYNLIEEKEKSLTTKVDVSFDENLDENIDKNEKKQIKYENPHLKDIIEMKNKGMKTSEISKALNIGQGEVELIFELGKE